MLRDVFWLFRAMLDIAISILNFLLPDVSSARALFRNLLEDN